MQTTYRCPIHDRVLSLEVPCPDCASDYTHLPDPDTMTGDDRALELETLARNADIIMASKTNPIPAQAYLNRIACLVGRPIFDVELKRSNYSALILEARLRSQGQRKITPGIIREMLEHFPSGSNVIFKLDSEHFDPEEDNDNG